MVAPKANYILVAVTAVPGRSEGSSADVPRVPSVCRKYCWAGVKLLWFSSIAPLVFIVTGCPVATVSSAKPIIASLNGTSASILRESGSAFVVRAGDHIKLKNAILKFTKLSLKERNLMGKKGKIYFENNFSITKFMDNFISFMKH